jgi:hypothetical protein
MVGLEEWPVLLDYLCREMFDRDLEIGHYTGMLLLFYYTTPRYVRLHISHLHISKHSMGKKTLMFIFQVKVRLKAI